jgi:hypothetical protein
MLLRLFACQPDPRMPAPGGRVRRSRRFGGSIVGCFESRSEHGETDHGLVSPGMEVVGPAAPDVHHVPGADRVTAPVDHQDACAAQQHHRKVVPVVTVGLLGLDGGEQLERGVGTLAPRSRVNTRRHRGERGGGDPGIVHPRGAAALPDEPRHPRSSAAGQEDEQPAERAEDGHRRHPTTAPVRLQ